MFLVFKSARELTFLGNDPQSLMSQGSTQDVRTQIESEVNQDLGKQEKKKGVGGGRRHCGGDSSPASRIIGIVFKLAVGIFHFLDRLTSLMV